MATAEQIKLLVKAHFEKNEDRFRTTVLQLAASEARAGHTTQARELKELVDKAAKTNIVKLNTANPMFEVSSSDYRLDDLVAPEEIKESIRRLLKEYLQRDKLRHYGMENRRKVLLEGPSGTGKTMTASILARELNLSLFTIQMDRLISKFMGETSAKLRQIFESIDDTPGVYLFDEFDAIGADRTYDNEVGEMRRVLNAFLQMLENDTSDSVIVAATNNNRMLDQALYRRFDDVLHYKLPTPEESKQLLLRKLGAYFGWVYIDEETLDESNGLSQAEITRICDELVKDSILEGVSFSNHQIRELIRVRREVYTKEG